MLVTGIMVAVIPVAAINLNLFGDTIFFSVTDSVTGDGIPNAQVIITYNFFDLLGDLTIEEQMAFLETIGEDDYWFFGATGYTDQYGIAALGDNEHPILPNRKMSFRIVADGYTSNRATSDCAYKSTPFTARTVPDGNTFYVELTPGALPEPPTPLPRTLTVHVVDENENGIEGADVYFWDGATASSLKSPPDTADFRFITDSEGKIYFTGTGYYIICANYDGYTSDYGNEVYSFAGAASIQDLTYTMDLYTEKPDDPDTPFSLSVMGIQLAGLAISLFGGFNYFIKGKKT